MLKSSLFAQVSCLIWPKIDLFLKMLCDVETTLFAQVSCPIRVARRVMEQSKHSMLVGAGAQAFAVAQGFAIEAHEELLGVESLAKYQEYKEKGAKQSGHDTLGLITLDREGRIAVGVTTSGMAFKEPGRVGDSPLPGPGLYVDGRYGAACATGDGDDILKFSPCSRVVMLMGQGLHPREACAQVVGDIAQVWKSGNNSKMLELGVVAMSVKGAYGAATTLEKWIDIKTGDEYPGFPFAVWHQTEVPEERIDVVKCV